jgi:hypothetical protein
MWRYGAPVAVVDTAGQVIKRSNTSISVDSVTSVTASGAVTAAVTEFEGNVLDDDLLMCMSLCNR